jgi:uncharacterized protein involved in type VI secretion and phage assembly
VNYLEGDPDHPIIAGGANGRAKLNGPQNGKHGRNAVKAAGKENVVNYLEGDPDHPILTGGANGRAITTGGRQPSNNDKTATGPGR